MPTKLHPEPKSPFHPGEVAMQRSVGMAERMAIIGPKVIRDFLPEQHREFFALLPFIVIATVDGRDDVWPTMLSGEPGFIQSPTPQSLIIGSSAIPDDPAAAGLLAGEAIGMLGIIPQSRRRNRMNGTISCLLDGKIQVEVGHSFGNCPQYITRREFQFVRPPQSTPEHGAEELDVMDVDARQQITTADTFFVASYVDRDEGRQIDVSHRGGAPGFVEIDINGTLTIPDYSGNMFFNTLGNMLVNPRAGLLFADFETGDLLQIVGRAEIITQSPEIAAFEGAQRIWKVHPTRIVRRRAALPLVIAPDAETKEV